MKIVFVTTCKPFIGEAKFIQEQSILSWFNLKDIEIKIIIIGNETGVKELCDKYNFINRNDVKKLKVFPYISEMLRIANEYANNDDIIIWTNADIVYNQTLVNTIKKFKKYFDYKDFLLVGQRLDWKNYKKIDLSNEELICIIKESTYHVPCGIDYLIHSKTSLLNKIDKKLCMPAICADQKILYTGLKSNIFVCDCTKTIIAIHHDTGTENRQSENFKLIYNNNLNCKCGWGNIKQCQNISYFNENNDINFKKIKDIKWYDNRLNLELKKKILNEENINKILLISLLK